MGESVDLILSNWENENFFMKGASVLEMLVHNLHMYETMSVAGKIYKKIKKQSKMRKNVNQLCKCMRMKDQKVLLSLETMARNFREEKDVISWRRYYGPDGLMIEDCITCQRGCIVDIFGRPCMDIFEIGPIIGTRGYDSCSS